MADKYGSSVFVEDAAIGENETAASLATKLANYSMHGSFKGMLLTDEPGNDSYATSSEKIEEFVNSSMILNSFSNLTGFINLYPYTSKLGNMTQYQQYLDEYCSTAVPKMLSYDYYPFDATGNSVKEQEAFFNNLAVVASTAKHYEIPFWTFVQAGSASQSGVPSAGAFKWSANMSLAFGAKGMSYFPLVEAEGYKGLIDLDGNTTDWYEHARALNEQIRSVDQVLMMSENEGIMVTVDYAKSNTSSCGDYNVQVRTSYKQVTGISSNEKGSYWGLGKTYGAVAGCFDYMGKTAIYLVKYDIGSAHNITVQFDGTYNYQAINHSGVTEGNGSSYTALALPAGEAVLVVIK